MSNYNNRKLLYKIMNSEDELSKALNVLMHVTGEPPVMIGNTVTIELPADYIASLKYVEKEMSKKMMKVIRNGRGLNSFKDDKCPVCRMTLLSTGKCPDIDCYANDILGID